MRIDVTGMGDSRALFLGRGGECLVRILRLGAGIGVGLGSDEFGGGFGAFVGFAWEG